MIIFSWRMCLNYYAVHLRTFGSWICIWLAFYAIIILFLKLDLNPALARYFGPGRLWQFWKGFGQRLALNTDLNSGQQLNIPEKAPGVESFGLKNVVSETQLKICIQNEYNQFLKTYVFQNGEGVYLKCWRFLRETESSLSKDLTLRLTTGVA